MTRFYSKLLRHATLHFDYVCFPMSSRERDCMWAQLQSVEPQSQSSKLHQVKRCGVWSTNGSGDVNLRQRFIALYFRFLFSFFLPLFLTDKSTISFLLVALLAVLSAPSFPLMPTWAAANRLLHPFPFCEIWTGSGEFLAVDPLLLISKILCLRVQQQNLYIIPPCLM